MVEIARLSAAEPDFWERLARLRQRGDDTSAAVEQTVRAILDDVRARGDAAVLEYTRRFDRREAGSVGELVIPADRLRTAAEGLANGQRLALEHAEERLRAHAERQRLASWSHVDEDGTLLGEQITALDRAGLYVPGGKAAYPSSVLMNAVPAKVAGVGEIVMVAPAPDGEVNDLVLAAAHIAGVDRVFALGGAQAVGALAYGTETVPAVDKIVGPGNVYVATAKRLVFGTVGIDMIAGPSEILIVCDGETDPEWVAMDLFSQAEHDEDAQAVLIAPDGAFIERVAEAVDRLVEGMERADIIRTSLTRHGALIEVRDLDEAAEVVNRIAPEHLELSVADPHALVRRIRHAGAIFLGRYSAEVLGDYCAGPNHVLPTGRTARFSSPLGVYDFQKRSSLIEVSAATAATLGPTAARLARGEGLTAHARSAELRAKPSGDE